MFSSRRGSAYRFNVGSDMTTKEIETTEIGEGNIAGVGLRVKGQTWNCERSLAEQLVRQGRAIYVRGRKKLAKAGRKPAGGGDTLTEETGADATIPGDPDA